MAQTYTRQSSFADGDTITAALFNNEYNQLVNAFAYSSSSASSTGHRHDGTAGQGGNIHTIGDLDFLNKIVVDSTNNRWGVFVEVSSAAVEQIRIQDGAILPVTDNDIDLGTSSLEFKDAYFDGTVTTDALVADTADINGGTVDGATIGANSASTGAFTSVTTTGNVDVGGNLTVTGTTTFNGGTLTLGDAASDNVVFGADVDSSIIPDDDDTYDLGSSSQEWRNLFIDGTANIDSLVADTADINGGTVDGAIIGGSSAAAITGTTITGTSFVIGSADISEAELETIDGVTAGTVAASKAIVVDSNKDFTGARNITLTGELDAGSLDVSGDVDVDGTLETDALSINGTAVTSTAAELNILDGVTSTAAELNILDGVTATAAEINVLDGITSTVAELNILDGVTASAADINLIDGITNGTVIASKAIITDSNKDITGGRNITISGELDAATLDISGDADIDGTLEADAITIAGVTLAETISDTVGAMVTSNTETGVTVTYDDSDNTLDFVIGTLNQDTTGNAATATALETARTIHGVSFDGTANIDLSEVVQDTVGAMFSSNTETGITATYQDSDGTIDLAVGNVIAVAAGASASNIASGGTVTFAGTSNEIDVAESSGTITYGLPTNVTIGGTLTAATLDISGDVDIDGTLEADAYTVNGTSLEEFISDTTGAMFTSNTESGITVTYQDADNTIDLAVDAAQTGITSLLATDIKIGEDDQTKIDFETADEIHFYAANAEQVYVADGIFGPQTDSDVDLGSSSVRWKDAYVDSLTTTGAITVGGNLTVNGTTTTVNSTTVTVDDPIFTLGGDSAPGSDDNKDRGIEFRWHDGSAAKLGFFGYDDSATAFTFIPDSSNSSEVFSGSAGNVVFGGITGTSGTISGDLTVDTSTLKVDSSNNRVGIGNASPDVSLDIGSFTDAIHVPVGTTAQRPASPAAGYFRYNTTTSKFEGYTDSWGAIAGGGSGTNMDTNIFAGDGSDTTFTLSTAPDDENNLMVFVDGVFQAQNVYSVSGTTLTFATAPANGRVITVYHSTTTVGGSNNSIATMTGDGSDTTLTLSVNPVHENNVSVFFDGVYQSKSNYSISGTTLTFSTAPASGVAVEAITATNTSITTATQLVDADSDTMIQVEESSDEDTIRFDIAGAEDFTMTANTFNALSGSTIKTDTIAETTSASGVTVDSVLLKDGSVTSAAGGTFTTASGNDLNIVYPDARSLFIKEDSTTHVTVDNTGQVGIGTSPSAKLHVTGTALIDGLSNYTGLTVKGSGGSRPMIQWSNANNGALCAIYGTEGNEMVLTSGSSNTERMRILSTGQVSFGTSSPLAGSRIFTLASASTPYGLTTQNDATTGTMFVMVFHSNGASNIGSITTTNTATAFNTSSDYRLKENVRPIENGLERLNNLNPVKFDWKEDGTTSEGFIAHEAQEVFPDAVSGEKDGEEMQGMDYGRITPLLVKAIQEQQTIIEDLKARIETLEG